MNASIHRRHGALEDELVAAVHDLAKAVQNADGVEPLGEQTTLDVGSDGADHVLVADGSLDAYGQLGPEHSGTRTAELVVAPGSRGAGLGGRVLAALLDIAQAQDAPVRVWAHGTLAPAAALARRAGLTAVRELWRMTVDLDPGAEAPDSSPGWAAAGLPPGVRLRPFRTGDEDALLAVNGAAFARHPEQGGMTRADLDARRAEPWFHATDLALAVRRHEVLGFAWTKVTPPLGELYVLGVAPAAQGRGLGRALTAAAVQHLRHRGCTRAVLFTEADNTPAVRTYRAAGFTVDRSDTQFAPQ
ncbi:mycothiol synthase [Isoptericola sp. b441]|uniref:Mycothiol acetyltransferase n=1 Tax=Actinotalea lenta TaxID=3064654 RepID=A0ABT9D8Q0_9CELL|nr:mycothiol synthase [Isoptericola sp. b441]MDO8106508.1 mycothiol synthase [Isoptericola sp. b441]